MKYTEEIAAKAVELLDESQLLIPFSRERSFEETKNQAKIIILAAIEEAEPQVNRWNANLSANCQPER